MKRKIFTIFILFLSISTLLGQSKLQFDKVNFNRDLYHSLFRTTDSVLNPLTLKTELVYDNFVDSTNYEIKSTVLVNKDPFRHIRFTELHKTKNDTLTLSIYETNAEYYHKLKIKIIKNKFHITYDYNMSGQPIEPKIRMITQKLTLKSLPKKSGDLIFGKVYFKGICNSGCKDELEIKGYFKAKME